MITRFFFLALICVTAFPHSALGDEAGNIQTLTLGDCIRIAVDQSPTIAGSKDALIGLGIRQTDARHDRIPSAELTLSDNRIIDEEAFSFYDPQTGQRYVPGEGYQAVAGLDATVYSGGRITASIRAADAARVEAELGLLRTIRDVRLDAVTRYITVLERQAECAVRREQIVRAQEALKLAENRLAAGRGIRYEVMLEQAFLSRSQLEALRADNALQIARHNLLLLLRMPLDTPIDIEDIDVLPDTPPDDAELIRQAREKREDIRRSEALRERRDEELRMLTAAHKPSVHLFAQYMKQGESLSDFSRDDNQWLGGLSIRFSPFPDSTLGGSITRERIGSSDYMQRSALSLSLFDGSSTRATEADLRAQIHAVDRDIAQLRDRIAAEVTEAAGRVRESAGECDTAERERAAAAENHLIQAKSYELGLTQFKDLVDARTDEISARIDLLFARYQYALDRAILDHVTGNTAGGENGCAQ